jgi:hypothetical protein
VPFSDFFVPRIFEIAERKVSILVAAYGGGALATMRRAHGQLF